MILSTGIAELSEIYEAVEACKRAGNNEIALLKCTSAYPAPIEEANLLTIPDMKERFGTIVGLSDHTIGITASVTAVALGARIIEKHFILNRNLGGPDATFSMEPAEFRQMVASIRELEKALGKVTYELSDKVKNNRQFSRSLFAVKDIKKGEIFTEENVRSIRPGYGLPPKFLKSILGKESTCNLKKGTPLSKGNTNCKNDN